MTDSKEKSGAAAQADGGKKTGNEQRDITASMLAA